MLNLHSSRTPVTLVVCLAVAVLSGCDNTHDEEAPPAAAEVPAAVPRPEALSQAIAEIKAGQAAEAQARLEAFLKDSSKDIYAPEAHYLMGQALAAQGQHKEAKKQLDQAIDDTRDRTLKALAMLGRADCNMALKKWNLASRQYHWLETVYRDVKAVPQDEVLFKLGLATKNAGFDETADHWFTQVIELYSTSAYATQAKQLHTKYTPQEQDQKSRVYTLQVGEFSDQQKADAQAQSLRDKGYREVQVLSTTRNSLPIYEVHIGKFETKNEAAAAQTDAELAGVPSTIRPATFEPLK